MLNEKFTGIIILALFPFLNSFSQNNKPLISAAPAWVTSNAIDYTQMSLDKEAEDGYIDLDFEKQVNLNEQSVYIKHSTKILSEAGVQDSSDVTINFYPTYQQLVILSIELIRNGVIINKLRLGKIKIIHVETELDKFIYEGQLQATIILDDVRKNDIIQYSYTLKGFNPVFQNKYQTFIGNCLNSCCRQTLPQPTHCH